MQLFVNRVHVREGSESKGPLINSSLHFIDVRNWLYPSKSLLKGKKEIKPTIKKSLQTKCLWTLGIVMSRLYFLTC